MIRRLPVVSLLLAMATGAVAATPACQFDRQPVGTQKIGQWIDKSNWLADENLRLTLHAGEVFMPAWRLAPSGDRPGTSARQTAVDNFPTVDPLDGSRRDLAFLLDSRAYADGLVVLRNGRLVAERYRNGLPPDRPRLLQAASRPLLNLLGAISIGQGKLAPDKAVSRYLPSLNASTGLRKRSIKRLLENEERPAWTAEELAAWRRSAGWTTDQASTGLRAWLSQPGRWDSPPAEPAVAGFDAAPDDDLLAWILAESHAMPLARLFCEQLLGRNRPEHAVLWLTDAQGVELADGLALSLRDFAKLGQALVDARGSRNRGKIPAWFIETLTASSGLRSTEIRGLAKGSEQRYGFVHLGGRANRVALLGNHGTSLYVDFDQRLVVALYASYPRENTPALLATLEKLWQAVDQATAPGEKRSTP